MGKFKKSFGEPKSDEEVQLGMGLLNEVSKSMVVERKDETVYIDMNRLKPNDMNHYSIEDIEDIGEAIRMAGGILQNIIVKPADEDGYYTITTGERRWRGAQWLKERGEYPKKLNNRVPCTIKEPDEFDLPLDKKNKEMFAILVTNKYREKTDGDKFMELRQWKEIFTELRKSGVEYLHMKGSTEADVEDVREPEESTGIKMKGVPTRELIAKQMNISTGQVSRLDEVDRKGSESVVNGLLSNKIDLSTAQKLAKLPAVEQDRIMEHFGKDDTKKRITESLKNLEEKQKLSKRELLDDMMEITDAIEEQGVFLELKQKEYEKYKKCIKQLVKIIKNGKDVPESENDI